MPVGCTTQAFIPSAAASSTAWVARALDWEYCGAGHEIDCFFHIVHILIFAANTYQVYASFAHNFSLILCNISTRALI